MRQWEWATHRTVELFNVKLEEGDLDKMRDVHGTICFHPVFEWLLPKLGKGLDEGRFYEFVATRMRTYMIQIMRKCTFRPELFGPYDEKSVTTDNIIVQ